MCKYTIELTGSREQQDIAYDMIFNSIDKLTKLINTLDEYEIEGNYYLEFMTLPETTITLINKSTRMEFV